MLYVHTNQMKGSSMGDSPAKDTAAKPKAERKLGNYVVLQQNGAGFEIIESSVKAATGTEAKKQVAGNLSIAEGEGVTLVAVPEKSFQPQTYKVERPAPRLVTA